MGLEAYITCDCCNKRSSRTFNSKASMIDVKNELLKNGWMSTDKEIRCPECLSSMATIVKVSDDESRLLIDEITLISERELNRFRDQIQLIGKSWWTRSSELQTPFDQHGPYRYLYVTGYALCCENVDNPIGNDRPYFCNREIAHSKHGVRPALRLSQLSEVNIEIGDKIELAGYLWTRISKSYFLCDDIIGESIWSRFGSFDEAANWPTSEIRKYLLEWASRKGLKLNPIYTSTSRLGYPTKYHTEIGIQHWGNFE